MLKIRKYEIITVSFVFVMSLFVLNVIYAQDVLDSTKTLSSEENFDTTSSDSTLDDETSSDDIKDLGDDKSEIEYSEVTNVVEDDKESIDSIRQVSETLRNLRTEARQAEEEVKRDIKDGIDRNIIDIRQRTDTAAFELQRSIDERRQRLYQKINNTLGNIRVDSAPKVEKLTEEVDKSFDEFEESLRGKSGINDIEFDDERRSIKNTLLKFKTEVEEKRELIKDRGGDRVYEDSDNDGVSDYDEIYIYRTNPNKAKSVDGDLSDGDKIKRGIDPLSESEDKMAFEDPRQDRESYVSPSYVLDSVAVVKEAEKKSVLFTGKAIPNSYVTVYIYSTPIIVTVKTDDNGEWSYELEEELEDGEHQLYVATVNNSGKIIARSNPILFTKTAEAAAIGVVGLNTEASSTNDFFRENFILIALLVLVGSVVLALMFVGNKGGVKEVVTGLKDEINNPKI